MTSILLAKPYYPLPCFILYSNAKFACYSRYFLASYFAFQSPIMKRTSFGVLVLEGLVYLHRTIQCQLLQHYWLGHRLGLLWYWMVCLGRGQRSSCRFWDCIQVLYFGRFCWLLWLLYFFSGIFAHSSRYNGHLSEFYGAIIPVSTEHLPSLPSRREYALYLFFF